MGAAFLSFWCYMGKAEDSSGHPFELEPIRLFFYMEQEDLLCLSSWVRNQKTITNCHSNIGGFLDQGCKCVRLAFLQLRWFCAVLRGGFPFSL